MRLTDEKEEEEEEESSFVMLIVAEVNWCEKQLHGA